MPVDYAQVKKIFLEALEEPLPQDRQQFIEEACGTDIDLRNFVLGMLEVHYQHATPIPEGPTRYDPQAHGGPGPALEIGSVLAGKYKIIELIAEGGMGSVYRATRVTDLRMEVAIKVIKPGMDSHQILARFNMERQALALMKHENIARVLDAGMTEQHLPFFVMELVKGLSLTKFCDQCKLSIQQRLELFEQICSAIQHAHQKGIVHRDLKPNNILVALFDDKHVPKVIDFGLAKALHQPLTDDVIMTKFGTFVGTWQYTAPEQAQLNNLDIDTRADIYSLGVILYELLTGTTPLEKKRLVNAAYEEVLRIIREEEPLKPSTKIHSSDQLPSIAALRHTEPLKLEKQIRGELDWIVMKALDKDRNRRYATANEFGRDINAFLHGEQVTAAPPTMGYRLACFYRKNKGKILTAAAMALLLIAGAITSTIGFINSSRSEKKALEQLATTTALFNFIESDMFSAIDADERAKLEIPMGSNIKVRDLLERSVMNLNRGRYQDNPLVEGRLRSTIGKAYYSIGLPFDAEKQFLLALTAMEKQSDPMNDERIQIIENLGSIACSQEKPAEARKRFLEVVDYYENKYGKDCDQVQLVKYQLCSIDRTQAKTHQELMVAEKKLLTLLEKLREKKDYVTEAKAQMLHADIKALMSNREEARKILERALASARETIGPDHPACLGLMNNYARVLKTLKINDKAEEQYQELIARAERVLDQNHPFLALYRNNYGSLLVQMQRPNEATDYFQKSFAAFNNSDPSHSYTIMVKYNIAGSRLLARDYQGAEPVLREVLVLCLEKYGLSHIETQFVLCDYARTLVGVNKYSEATAQLKMLVRSTLGTEGKDAAKLRKALAEIKSLMQRRNQQTEFIKILGEVQGYIKATSPDQLELMKLLKEFE